MSRILIATSIPPHKVRVNGGKRVDAEYQDLCIRSWRECGFEIASLSDPDEIAALAPRYPDVTFVPTARDASASTGRKNPYIIDLLRHLAVSQAQVVGIANADIVFQPSPTWTRELPLLVAEHLIAGQRLDGNSLSDGMLQRHSWGFDYFFFDRGAAELMADRASPFAMGLPWWDYWLPLMLAFRGRGPVRMITPKIIHLFHDTVYDPFVWRQVAVTLAQGVVSECRRVVPEAIARTSIPALCEQIVQLSLEDALERGAGDEGMRRLARACANFTAEKIVKFETHRGELVGTSERVAVAFERVEERSAVGEAIITAKDFQLRGDIRSAEIQLQTALRRMPDDVDTLFYYGELSLKQGNLRQAELIFAKIVKLKPEFANGVNTYGAVLEGLGRLPDAIHCYERALAIDPEFVAAYVNLALALRKIGREQEGLRRFEAVLAVKPHIGSAPEYFYRLRERLRELSGAPRLHMEQYFGRWGEDALVDQFFGFKNRGRFADLVAGDGKRFNASYVLEQRGWNGVCAEANAALFARCVVNRPGSVCLHDGDENGLVIRDTMMALAPLDVIFVDGSNAAQLASLEKLSPRIMVVDAGDECVFRGKLADCGYRFARSVGGSRFYVRNEQDLVALQAMAVSAKLAPVAVPLHREYVYWPAEPVLHARPEPA